MRGIFRRETATLKRSISSPLLFRFKKAVVGLSDDFYSSLGSVSFDESKLTHESSSPADGLTRGIVASGRKKRALFPSSTAFTHKAEAQDPFVLTQSWNEESDSEDCSQQGCPGDEQREELNHDPASLPGSYPSCLSSLCLSNASIYHTRGKPSKARCMRLLSTLVRGKRGGRGEEGALGSKMVGRVLDLHPNDPQFITIVFSILRHTPLLPKGESDRFSRMGRIYGDMLGRWGELEEMAICGKHISLPPPSPSVLTFGSICGVCGKAGDGGSFCGGCRNFKLRCGVCEGRIFGSYVMCFNCGHGFCLDHAREWFSENEQCPTGCGCECQRETYGKVGGMEYMDEGGTEGTVEVPGIGRRGVYDGKAMSIRIKVSMSEDANGSSSVSVSDDDNM